MYELTEGRFITPRGRLITMWVRTGTNDWNTLNSCLTEDEYGLKDLRLSGWALDIGAYSGGVTVALLVDNPDLQVVAVEPVPGNVELLLKNLAANDLLSRCEVIEGAAGDGSEVNIRYGYSGSELATHHAFVGNMAMLEEPGPENPHEVRRLRTQRITELGHDFAFVKVDAEGAEWDLIPDLRLMPHIRGEWHPVRGHTQVEWVDGLIETHHVTTTGPTEGPGGFTAVLR